MDIGNLYTYIDPRTMKGNRHLIEMFNCSLSEKDLREQAERFTRYEVGEFFRHIQTVICTGADGIAPKEHKAFLAACVVSTGVNPPAGKYLVTDLSSPSQAVPKSVMPKTVLSLQRVDIEKILRTHDFIPGRVVMEQNGVVKMFAGFNGEIVPFVFKRTAEALEWLEHYYAQMGWGWPEPVEMDECSLRFLLPTTNDKGEQDEILISFIQYEDVDAYVDQTMMVSMEVEEYLSHPELMEEVPGLNLQAEAANVTLQKLVSYACRNYRRVRKVCNAELPIDEETQQSVASMFEEYRWRPYEKLASPEIPKEPESAAVELPQKRVLFLGGHANMVKKLRQMFPDWDFLTDDELGSWTGRDCEVVFLWSNHCSHSLWKYVNVRKGSAPYLYVTATNINRLVSEMVEKYREYQKKQSALPI